MVNLYAVAMIRTWLKKPFPYIESLRDQLLMSLAAGGVVTGFLLLFQPFGIDALVGGIFWHVAVFGLIAAVVIALNLIILPLVIPHYVNAENWTIGKNLVFIFWILFVISFCNFAYGEYLADSAYTEVLQESNRTGLLSWIFMTFSVGIFPVFLLVYFSERQLLKKHQRFARELSEDIAHTTATAEGRLITLETGKASAIEIHTSRILCVRADGGNYITVYWQDGQGGHRELIRMTLRNFLEKVAGTGNFVRCHKSYIVNRDKIEKVRGNARSLVISIQGLDFQVPVSRAFPRRELVSTG